jgi:uncharacterized membrane protein YkvA (DUF1232 family)
MSDNTKRKITYPKSEGFFDGLMLRIKLIFRLMGDSRVSPTLKLLPIGSLIYLVMPLDIPGPIDDALVLWLATTFFVELCPSDVVQEHLEALNATRKVMDNYQETAQPAQGEVVDGEIVDGDSETK